MEAIIKALKNQQAKGQIFNLGSGKKISLKHIVSSIKNFYKKGSPIYGRIKLRKDENRIIFADITKSKKLLRWKPKINFIVGLSKTLKHYKNKYKKI